MGMYSLIIIDDEPKIAEGMAQLFPWNNIGFQVVRSFTSAAEALEYLDENPVDVVLSDIQMPDMTGLELCEKLLGREKTQVVLFSSYQNYEYFRSAIQMGVADYLLKPLTYQALTETFTKLKEKLDEASPAEPEQPAGYYEGLIQQVDEYLRGHLQDATLTRCAKRVALSPSYLSRISKEYSGKNFMDRLLELRMERAKLMETINDAGSRSIGLTNLNRRLILRYGAESALRIASVPFEETTVSFEIPYDSERPSDATLDS